MRYLLDVNALVAWGWADHVHHDQIARWIQRIKRSGRDTVLTSAIPQLGFVRVSIQRRSGRISPEAAGEVLSSMVRSLGAMHQFLPDDQNAFAWPAWCEAASRTTDAHLLALAARHGAKLATLDEGIPGGFLIA